MCGVEKKEPRQLVKHFVDDHDYTYRAAFNVEWMVEEELLDD